MKKYLLLFVATLWVVFTCVSSLWASELFGKITYKGGPLKNAEITVQEKKIKTNDIGYYSLDLDPGSYMLIIKLPDGSTRSEKVEIFPQNTEKNLKME